MKVLWIVLTFAGTFTVAFLVVSLRDSLARRSGSLPAAGQATMADVKSLIQAGQRLHAIRCYREIHRCGLADAKKAIDEMTRSM